MPLDYWGAESVPIKKTNFRNFALARNKRVRKLTKNRGLLMSSFMTNELKLRIIAVIYQLYNRWIFAIQAKIGNLMGKSDHSGVTVCIWVWQTQNVTNQSFYLNAIIGAE